MNFSTWVRQPTNILALSIGIATVAGLGVYFVTGDVSAAVGVAGVGATIVAASINEASATKADAEKLEADLIAAISTLSVADVPAVVTDAVAIVRDIEAYRASVAPTAAAQPSSPLPAITH